MTDAKLSSYKNGCCLETWEMKDKFDRELWLDEECGRRKDGKANISPRQFNCLLAWNQKFSDALKKGKQK